MAIFGHYLTSDGLLKIKNYKYQSGQYTFLDSTLNYFWNFCIEFVPLWVAPNILTLFGFLSSWIAFITAMIYTPNLVEATPPIACYIIAISVFMYQTLDAIDGKQARRTNTSSSLGTLFDHGCDIITGTILAITAVAISRCGSGLCTFIAVMISSQLMQFLYLWWEYHFHVFFSNPGYGTGVTEAQVGIILFSLASGFYGADIWLIDVLTLLPKNVTLWVMSNFSIKTLQISHIAMYIIIVNNLASAIYILVMGISKLPNHKRTKALIQTSSFIGFLVFEGFFYYSAVLRLAVYPPLAFLLITASYSTICIRILLSSTSKRYYHSLQWPATPFCVIASVMFCEYNLLLLTSVFVFSVAPYVSASLSSWIDANYLWLIIADLGWQLFYLTDLLVTSIDDICNTLGVKCFTISLPSEIKKD